MNLRVINMEHIKVNLVRIKFWIKCNCLRLITASGCMAFGSIIGIFLCKNIDTKHDWSIGILTGLMTSIIVSAFLDSYNKSTQKKKDDAIKRATMFDFWNNMILQCMHILSYKYPLYHLACDIDDMEKFVKERITPIQIQCQNTIRYYSAALTKLEFETLNNVLLQSQIITSSIDGPLWNEIRGEKERYHRFYDFLGNRDKALQELSEKDYYEIRKNVKCFYLQLRSYLNALENAIDLFHYLFHESESYKKLHSDIKADTKNQGLLDK